MDNGNTSDYNGLQIFHGRSTLAHGGSPVLLSKIEALSHTVDRTSPLGEIARVIAMNGRVLWTVSGPVVDGGNGAVAVFRTRGAARRFLRGAA